MTAGADRTLPFIAALGELAGRQGAARVLARRLGAEELVIFIEDREATAWLPAQGFPKTLPDGRRWQRFLGDCVAAQTPLRADLPYPDAASVRPALGLACHEDSVAVLLGGHPDPSRLDEVRDAMPLLNATFRAEHRAAAGDGHLRVARLHADRAEALTASLSQSQAALHGVIHRLSESQRWLSATLASIGDAVVVTDAEGKISFMNAVAERLTGWSQAEAGARPSAEVLQLLDETTRAAVESPVSRVVQVGAVVALQDHTLLKRRDGTLVSIDDSAAPIRDAEGRLTGVVLVFRDVSGRRRAEQELAGVARDKEALVKELETALRARESFLAIVSHDLRNPLGTIHMASALLHQGLSSDPANSRAFRQVSSIQRASERMGRLIGDLLDFASIEAGKLKVERRPCQVNDLLREACESQEGLAGEKALTLQALPFASKAVVLADRERILQVFSNLIGNAIKFTPQRGSIMLGAEERDGVVRFRVSDDGPGIRSDFLPHLFEPYRQATESSRLGVGLGLFIAKGIVEAHGGQIHAESAAGQGASFFFTVPSPPG